MVYERIRSVLGILCFLLVSWIFSNNKKIINWKVIVWGIFLQAICAFFVFHFPLGTDFFKFLNEVVLKMLSFAKKGSYFLFGILSISPGEENSLGFILAFQALPTIIFFSAFISFLYYIKVMQFFIRIFSFVFTKLMNISGAESLCVSSNIFVGIESVFTIRPYIEKMTKSELCTILTAGLATIASSVLGVYVSFLYKTFPQIAGHLISASLMSAPASIVISKILYPEDGKPLTLGKVVKEEYEKPANWVESIIIGATEGTKLLVGIVALLLAFLGFLSLFDFLLLKIGNLFSFDLSFEKICSFIFYPFVYLMGVPYPDIKIVSNLVGKRLIVTELVSYQEMANLISNGVLTNVRSITIASYALCGFAHIASLSIFVGGISALIPSRRKDLSMVGFKALLSANLACLMTGAIAGIVSP